MLKLALRHIAVFLLSCAIIIAVIIGMLLERLRRWREHRRWIRSLRMRKE